MKDRERKMKEKANEITKKFNELKKARCLLEELNPGESIPMKSPEEMKRCSILYREFNQLMEEFNQM